MVVASQKLWLSMFIYLQQGSFFNRTCHKTTCMGNQYTMQLGNANHLPNKLPVDGEKNVNDPKDSSFATYT